MLQLKILNEAIKKVPAVRFALAIAGILSVLSLIPILKIDYKIAVFGTVIMMVLMVAMMFLARAAKKDSDTDLRIMILTWTFILITCATAICLFTSTFFGEPVDLKSIIFQESVKLRQDSKFKYLTLVTGLGGEVLRQDTLQVTKIDQELGGNIKLEMVEIPAGTFIMGTSRSDIDKYELKIELTKWFKDLSPEMKKEYDSLPFSESPEHLVTLNKFYMGKYEITQAQWKQVAKLPMINYYLPDNPSVHIGDNKPVDNISFRCAMEFCARLSKFTGRNYSLPTEAQWEYACRGGTTTQFCFGDNIQAGYVNFKASYQFGSSPRGINRQTTLDVGQLGYANRFGLYDMPGSVWEWCIDRWHNNFENAPLDGSAWLKGGLNEYRVVRGGSWEWIGYGCRSAYRNYREESETITKKSNGLINGSHGFRVVF